MKSVFGLPLESGSKQFAHVPVGEYANGALVTIPVMVMCARQQGPVLWLNGAVHGAELNGSVAAYHLFQSLSPDDFRGTLVITPVANPLGFQRRDKISDLDYQDMDTAFPGKPNGTFTERIAHMIYSEIRSIHPDCVLSMHTMGPFWESVCYTVSKIVPNASQQVMERSYQLALSFGLEINCHFDLATAQGELPGVTQGALDIACIKDGIPCFMAEMGGGGRLQSDSIKTATVCLKNLMMTLGMLDGDLYRPSGQRVISRRGFLRCDHGGLVEMHARPGIELKKGENQCNIHYFGEESYECPLAADTFFIGTRLNPVVNTGDPISFVGTEWKIIG